MRRREFITLLSGTAAGWPRAEQPPTPVIEYLHSSSQDPAKEDSARRQGEAQ